MWHKLSQNYSFLSFICFLVALMLISLHFFGILRPFENLIFKLTVPLGTSAYNLGNKISNLLNFFSSIKNLADENKKLKSDLEKLMAEAAKLKEVEKENEELRQQLAYQERFSYSTIPALVVNRDPNNLLKSISINRGKKEGVKEKAAVIVSEGILIGRVSEVYENYSKVLLIVDSHSRIPAQVQESQAFGLVLGEHGLGLIMDMIPQDKVVNKGDTVVTSDIGNELPKGLLIGKIEEVNAADNELFQKARIKSPVDFKELNSVFVLKN